MMSRFRDALSSIGRHDRDWRHDLSFGVTFGLIMACLSTLETGRSFGHGIVVWVGVSVVVVLVGGWARRRKGVSDRST
jgi:hypothetical protein